MPGYMSPLTNGSEMLKTVPRHFYSLLTEVGVGRGRTSMAFIPDHLECIAEPLKVAEVLQSHKHHVAAYLVRLHAVFLAANVCSSNKCQKSKKFTKDLLCLLEDDKKELQEELDAMNHFQRLECVLGLAERIDCEYPGESHEFDWLSSEPGAREILSDVSTSIFEDLASEEIDRNMYRIHALRIDKIRIKQKIRSQGVSTCDKDTTAIMGDIPALPDVPTMSSMGLLVDEHIQNKSPPPPSSPPTTHPIPESEPLPMNMTRCSHTYEPTQYDRCGVSDEAIWGAETLASKAATLLRFSKNDSDVQNIRMLIEKALVILESEDIC